MDRELFQSFYNGTIDRIASIVIQKNSDFTYRECSDAVYEEYLNQKTALRYLIKGPRECQVNKRDDDSETSGDLALLDGHKVSACITTAIMRVRLVTYNETNDTNENVFLLETAKRLNEQIAVLCGLSCLLSYMKTDEVYLHSKNSAANITKLIFPETKYPERSSYLDSLIRGLYYSNLVSTVNPLLLAHIYFMIERYHRKCIELEEFKS